MRECKEESGGRRVRWSVAPAVAAMAALALAGNAAAQSEGGASVTYSREVSRVMQENCQICHQPGQIGPMSLMTYQQVRRYARRIRDLVANREMPPYHYDTDVGIQELDGDWRLSQADINTVIAWVDAGTPEGDPADLPAPRDFPDMSEWRLAADFGQPDHVIESAAWDVPANGQDLWWEPQVPTGITEERCIQAIETKPSVAAHGSTHHANSQFLTQNEEGEWVTFGRLSEFAFGKLGEVVPNDACRIAPTDSRVEWSIHYYPDGNAVPDDQVEVGIWYHDESFDREAAYKQDLRSYGLQGGDFDIAPHGKLMTQGFHSFDHPVRLDSWQPHLHLRGVAMSMEVFYPETGRREMISMASNWNAGWNLSHIYADGHQPLLPAGAVIILTGWYDNTANNPRNPDPDQWVAMGQRTTDEMSHAWIAVTHLDEEGYQRLLAERERKPVAMGDVR
ncbi:MAG TPA: cytochrome c [Longimicrobiales bacterium]|nr:cytochrome c [Longimicrobiales bacterium]